MCFPLVLLTDFNSTINSVQVENFKDNIGRTWKVGPICEMMFLSGAFSSFPSPILLSFNSLYSLVNHLLGFFETMFTKPINNS